MKMPAASQANENAKKMLRKAQRLLNAERIDEAWKLFEKYDHDFFESIDANLRDKILETKQTILKKMINELKIK